MTFPWNFYNTRTASCTAPWCGLCRYSNDSSMDLFFLIFCYDGLKSFKIIYYTNTVKGTMTFLNCRIFFVLSSMFLVVEVKLRARRKSNIRVFQNLYCLSLHTPQDMLNLPWFEPSSSVSDTFTEKIVTVLPANDSLTYTAWHTAISN